MEKCSVYPRGTKLNCGRCRSHILTFAKDMYANDWVTAQCFEQAEGQGPWFQGDSCHCRKCGHNFLSGGHFFGEIVLPNMEVVNEEGVPGNLIECREDSEI